MALALLLTGCTGSAVSGRWGSWSNDEPYADLQPGGQLFGYDGCNSFSGTWEGEDQAIAFLEVATTLKGCLGNAPQWLSLARSGKMDGDHLVLFDEAGAELGSLTRP
jgi:heat shock protein HslJ